MHSCVCVCVYLERAVVMLQCYKRFRNTSVIINHSDQTMGSQLFNLTLQPKECKDWQKKKKKMKLTMQPRLKTEA